VAARKAKGPPRESRRLSCGGPGTQDIQESPIDRRLFHQPTRLADGFELEDALSAALRGIHPKSWFPRTPPERDFGSKCKFRKNVNSAHYDTAFGPVQVFFGASARDMSLPMPNRPILVTGGHGLLGRSLAALSTSDRPIVCLGRRDLDVTDEASIRGALEHVRPVIVVNAAAMTDVDGCERDPDKAMRENATGPRLLAEACVRAGVNIVQVSTDFVFDGSKREPYTIEDVPNPISVYGKSKLEGERAVLAARPEAVVVRTSWLFGIGGKNFASRIFDYAASSNRLKGIKDMRSLPTYAPDLAQRILEIVDSGAGGTFHITGGGEPATWFEVARAALDAAGRLDVELIPVTVAELGLPAPRPAYSALRCLRSEALGLPPMQRWNEAVEAFAHAVAEGAIRPPK